MRQPRGFTLLEVMLVLLLMGLIAGTISFTAFGDDPEQDLKKQAQRFQVVLNMASDHAVLNQQQLGVRIEPDNNRYFFLRLNENQQWRPIESNSPVLREHELPENFRIELSLNDLPWQSDDSLFDRELFDESLSVSEDETRIGDEDSEPPPPPQILILSSGDITPFSALFVYEPDFGSDQPVYFRVEAREVPPVTLSDPLDNPEVAL